MPTLRRSRASLLPGVTGTARVDRRTSALLRRLRPGDVAVVHHVDLDRASAEALVGCRVAAVVNAAESVSGRYPNLGPEVLAAAGVLLVDAVGEDVLSRVSEGDEVRVHDGVVHVGDRAVGSGEVLDGAAVHALTERARSGMAARLEAFTLDTAEHLRREHALLLEGAGVPPLSTAVAGRDVVVVTAAHEHHAELRALRRYLRGRRPVLVGVDAGADALLAAGLTPDLVVGDVDQVSDAALRAAGEVVVQVGRDAAAAVAPSDRDRLDRLGVEPTVFAAGGGSADAALLLVDAAGAAVVVTVGWPPDLVAFLDQGRQQMASDFLTRLRVSPRLLDARAAARLYSDPLRGWHLLLLVLAAMLALAVSVAATPVGEEWVDTIRDAAGEIVTDVRTNLPGDST